MSLRDRIEKLAAEVNQRTHENMTPSPDARGAYFLVSLALRTALASEEDAGARAPSTDFCGKRCDHGSECLLYADHQPPDRHETQHGCIFYSSREGGTP